MTAKRPSLLYLQMGQEVIYILLSCAILTSILLLSIVIKTRQERDQFGGSISQIERKLEESEAERRRLGLQVLALNNAAGSGTLRSEISKLEAQLADTSALRQERDNLLAKYNLLLESKNNDQPPIILLTEKEGYTFATGSAEVTTEFRERVRSGIVPILRQDADRYSASIIEVIGHTDEVPLTGRRERGNLDRALLDVLNEREVPGGLVPFDNVDLGMARAVSVRKLLIELGLNSFTILPLSAGPAITNEEGIAAGNLSATGVESRRRIEIRLRRKSRVEN